jgi:hypothetical protein
VAEPRHTLSVLRDRPEVSVARIALGLTIYTADPLRWARETASEALAMFCARAPSDRLQLFTTSLLDRWRPVGRRGLEEVTAALSDRHVGRPRHLLWFRVADDPGAPSVGFSYREIDPARGNRSGFVQMILPRTEGDALADLAVEVARRFPVLAAVGGHLATWNPQQKATAFSEIHGLCKRYLGLDAQDPDAMAWRVRNGLPGTNWLTLIGPALADRLRLDPAALAAGPWSRGIEARVLEQALLVRAGEGPVLGDLNRGEFPAAYAEVARRLGPSFVEEPPGFWGLFHQEKDTRRWLRRLVEPEGWE